MFRCCLGARSQVNTRAYQPQLDQSPNTNNSSEKKVEKVLSNTFKTQTRAASSAAGAGMYSYHQVNTSAYQPQLGQSPNTNNCSKEKVENNTLKTQTGAGAGMYSSMSAVKEIQVQLPVAPSTEKFRQEIIESLEKIKKISSFNSGDPLEYLDVLIGFLKKNTPADLDFVNFYINSLNEASKGTQIQGLSSLLEQCGNELMRNHLKIATKNVVADFKQGSAGGIKKKIPNTLKKLENLEAVQKCFPHYIACRGDGACAYTAMVKGTLLQLSKSDSSKLDNFLKEIINPVDSRVEKFIDSQVEKFIDSQVKEFIDSKVKEIIKLLNNEVKELCNKYLNKEISGNEFFQEINSNANYEAAIVNAAKSRVINELVTVFDKRKRNEKVDRFDTLADDMFFLEKEQVVQSAVANAELSGCGAEEYMTFKERIARISSEQANQVSSQEITMFAHVFGQSFLDINIDSGEIKLTQYPLKKRQQLENLESHNSNEQFALLMKTNGHHDVILKSNQYGN